MANAEQVKNLIKAYAEDNKERFRTISLQIAAYEARLGHDALARELNSIIEVFNTKKSNIIQMNSSNSMFVMSASSHNLSELIVSNDIKEKIERIVNEYRNKNKLASYGLANRRKILIEGNPGTGKTLTASIIASELSLPLFTVQMDKLVTKFLGETSIKLRQIFDSIDSNIGVYFFDEFDAIGADRNLDNEVGEMRRILNSFLQFIEQTSSESIILAATNNQKLLDQALFRRFDDILHYKLPKEKEIKELFEYRLSFFYDNVSITKELVNTAKGLSHAEITSVCNDAIKNCILNDEKITVDVIKKLIKDRRNLFKEKEA